MAKITYHTHDDKTQTIDVQNGLSVMEGAVQNDIPGIDADCGGGMACATCHVYVKEDWLDKLPTKEDGEEDMLDMAYEPKQNSRLSCQLIVSDELDGLEVTIPEKQACFSGIVTSKPSNSSETISWQLNLLFCFGSYAMSNISSSPSSLVGSLSSQSSFTYT